MAQGRLPMSVPNASREQGHKRDEIDFVSFLEPATWFEMLFPTVNEYRQRSYAAVCIRFRDLTVLTDHASLLTVAHPAAVFAERLRPA
jgi:hypothetical protein